ncbi:MAG TPA: hypothetical protein VMQ17_03085 [Candidatus Sulfotelmatobacter sp.]|nr:hypothetical protein [Candidatus Sulfotelmatobacter sp.]
MTIRTTPTTVALWRSSSFVYAIWTFFPGIVIGSVAVAGSGTRRRGRLLGSIAMLFLFLTLLSCGGVSSGGGGGGGHQGTREATTASPSLRPAAPTAPKSLSS